MALSETDAKIEQVLNRLRGALGTGEKPAGSNHNFITEWYNENVKKIGDGPWCEMTNTWSCWTGGAKKIKSGQAYTVWAVQDAQKGKLKASWHWGTKGMKKGDHPYFDWKRPTAKDKKNAGSVDHTGTAERINGDGTFYSLEGNTSNNKLERKLRDGKYVVGYVRLNWAALPDPRPSEDDEDKPAPSKPTTNPSLVARVQRQLRVPVDRQWGPKTDAVGQLMRTAARAKVGYPKNVKKSFDVRAVQRITGANPDGDFGPKSQAALTGWVQGMQAILGVVADGQWGPRTENAYLTARRNNFNKF